MEVIKSHKVVFPFNDIKLFKISFNRGRQNIGKANILSNDAAGRPYPVNIVSELFDSYEEAKMAAKERNKEYKIKLLVEEALLCTNWQEQMEKIEKEFEQKLALCFLFEKLI